MNRREFFKTIGVALTAGIAKRSGLLGLVPAWTATDEFLWMLQNQSLPRLDCFGISAGKVRIRYEELLSEGWDREQAFVFSVMTEVEALG